MELSELIDRFMIEDRMNYAAAHAKAWTIIQAQEQEQRDKRDDDLASRSVVI